MAANVEVTCPCCDTRLVVDAATGEILSEERPTVDHEKSFDSALAEVRGGAKRRGEAFDKAFEKTKRLDDLLEKKFEEAKKKAAKDTGKPTNPFDLD
jgi:ABC-type enterochelin transport system substrate-binding protein